MYDLPSAKHNRHIFSEQWDIIAFTLPIFLSVIAAPVIHEYVPQDSIPLWGYIILVVFTDVAHVWTTLFRVYFDSTENTRRPFLYNKAPFLIFMIQAAVHNIVGERFFWTCIGYFAIYHFVKQQYGFLMIAEAREQNFKQIKRDKRLLYALALLPIALWHCDDTRFFDWFNRDDPFYVPQQLAKYVSTEVGLPWGASLVPLHVGYFALVVLWAYFGLCMASDYKVCRTSGLPYPMMRTLLLLYSGLSWTVGVLFNHKLIALMFLNLFHAFPSFLIVYCSSMNRWRFGRKQQLSFGDRLGAFMSTHFTAYVFFLLILGSMEEFLWEVLVWKDYIPQNWISGSVVDEEGFGHSILNSVIVSLLILPQTTHYFLDMYIWKMGKDPDGNECNPNLKKYLALAPFNS